MYNRVVGNSSGAREYPDGHNHGICRCDGNSPIGNHDLLTAAKFSAVKLCLPLFVSPSNVDVVKQQAQFCSLSAVSCARLEDV
jgi:hypothetical protein